MKIRISVVAGALAALVVCAVWAAESAPAPRAAEQPGVQQGYRGFGLPLPSCQAAFVKKGDYVDVLVTFETAMDPKVKEKVTATLLQYVKVLDVRRPETPSEKGAIELLVNPNEAQFAALALEQGSIQILVRAEGDTEMKPMEMASFRKLFR